MARRDTVCRGRISFGVAASAAGCMTGTYPAGGWAAPLRVVLDRSGSMSLPGRSGAPRITEAKQAAALFVSLLTTAGGNRVGLVSFSTTATADRALANVNPGTKNALVGPNPPASGGMIEKQRGDLVPRVAEPSASWTTGSMATTVSRQMASSASR